MSLCTSKNPFLLPSHQELIDHLESELTTASALAKLLDQENELLQNTNLEIIENLNEVVETKQVCINQLEENARLRDIWTNLLQHQTQPLMKSSSFRQQQIAKQKLWLQFLDEDLIEKWNKIEQYILICKRLNSINGRLIGFRRQRNRRIEEILFGGSASETTYSANGEAVKSRDYQNSVRA